jgi:hypothetical protein
LEWLKEAESLQRGGDGVKIVSEQINLDLNTKSLTFNTKFFVVPPVVLAMVILVNDIE